MPNSTLDEIVVSAPRIYEGLNMNLFNFYYQVWTHLALNGRSNPFESGPHNLYVIDEAYGLADGQRALKEGAISIFVERFIQLKSTIDSFPDNSPIYLSSMESISGAQLKAKLASVATLRVTNKKLP